MTKEKHFEEHDHRSFLIMGSVEQTMTLQCLTCGRVVYDTDNSLTSHLRRKRSNLVTV